MKQAICYTCHQKNNFDFKIQILEKILCVLKAQNITNSTKAKRFTWNIHESCKFGLYCNELRHGKKKCMELAWKLNPLLAQVAENQERTAYYEILGLLRGNFPDVYRQLEQYYHQCAKCS